MNEQTVSLRARHNTARVPAMATLETSDADRPCLPAQVGDEPTLLVLDRDRTFRTLERRAGLFVAERCCALVISLGGAAILRPPAAALRKGAHPFERAGVALRGGLLEQHTGRNVVLRTADPVRHHQ